MALARTRVLEEAGSGNEVLAAAIAHLVTQTSETRLQQVLDAALGSDRRKLERFFARLPGGDNALSQAIRKAHGAGERDTAERIASEFCAEIKTEETQIRAAIGWLSGGGKTDTKYAGLLSEFLACGAAQDGFAALREIFLKADGEPRDKIASKKLAEADPALSDYLMSIAERYLEADERMRAAHAASLAEAALTLADAVRKIYAGEKRLRGVLDYDDLIAETLTLLKKREAAAWVLYKLDGGLDHILIDEAQDTSPEQWEIVRALTEEFFAGQGRERATRTIFAVGDEKQSIFSFQGADPVQFEINRKHFALHAKGDGEALVDVQLATSRRSAPEVLTFVDEVFADPAAREGLTSDGAEIKHSAYRANAKGRVEFWPAIKPADEPEQDWWRPVDAVSETSPVRLLAKRIAAKIKSWTDGRTRLPGHENPIRPGDIMILMRRREPFASEIIRHLKERGVPVAGADRIKLGEQIAVMDLIALGRFALLPEDDLNLASLLRSPLIGFSEEDLFALAADRKGTLWRELAARREEFGFAHEFLSEMLSRADYAPPHEFYAHALSARGMKQRLLARLGPEAEDAIAEFLSLSLDYEALNSPSLEGFLHWIERGDTQIKRDMERGRDEVRVMTVHGAKGLEADIVILPDTTTLPETPGKRGDILYTDDGVIFPVPKEKSPRAVKAAKDAAEAEALREHRRLLYVALTRAKDRLYICGFENKNGVREGSWYEMTEKAARSLGMAVAHGEETRHVYGEADTEAVTQTSLPFAERAELPDWAKTAPKPERPVTRIIRPSDAAPDTPAVLSPLDAKGEARFRRGLLVHAMLARLPDVAAEQRRATALAFLTARDVGANEAEALADHTLAVIDHPGFAEAFGPNVRAEVPIFADLPELGTGVRTIGRIDRFAVTDGRVLAIDFKTNRPPPARPEDVPRIYVAQMALYRAALEKVFPGRRIACALVWTEGPDLMELPDVLLEAEIGRIRARLDAQGVRS